LPLVPAAPHPDTQEILQTVTTEKPYLPSKRRQSYVMLFDAFVVSPEILEHLYAGTARLTEEAMALVTRKLTDEGRFESSFMALWRGSQRLKDEMLWNKRQVEEYERELAYRKMYDNVSKDARNGENVDENVMWKVLKFIIGIPAFVGEVLRELFWVFVVLMVVMGFVIFLLQLVHENFWTIIAGVLILGICRYYKVEIKEFDESLGRDGN